MLMKMISTSEVSECLSSSFEQELTERMNAVLQEKAESQQSLALLRKQHEDFKRQAQVTYMSGDVLKLSAHLIKH